MKNKTFIDSVKCAINGFRHALKTEKNFKIYILHVLVTFPINMFIGVSLFQHLIYWVTVCGVFSAECFNTAAEKICDAFTLEYNENVKIIKDVAAGGVLCWGFAFYLTEIIFIISYLL